MKFSINHLSKLIAPCVAIAIIAASNETEASITINFAQVGSDVIATTSGSLRSAQLGGMATSAFDLGLDGPSASSTSLVGIEGPDTVGGLVISGGTSVHAFSGGGVVTASGLTASANSFGRSAFGFTQVDGENVIFAEAGSFRNDFDFDLNQLLTIISPTTRWTFENQTLDSLGLGDLIGGNERVVYTDILTEDTIIFVPEPSSMLMLALGAVGFTFRRRR